VGSVQNVTCWGISKGYSGIYSGVCIVSGSVVGFSRGFAAGSSVFLRVASD